jgi:NTP pyrophosphatase (non-canonical NTP hydrolase)
MGTNESLTFAAFAAANRARCEAPDGFHHALGSWSLSDWVVAVTGELGEAANVVKKLNRVRDGVPGNTLTEAELRARLRSEIADAFIYLDLLSQSAGFPLEQAVRETFDAKSAQIGYPHRLVSPEPKEAADAPQA